MICFYIICLKISKLGFAKNDLGGYPTSIAGFQLVYVRHAFPQLQDRVWKITVVPELLYTLSMFYYKY